MTRADVEYLVTSRTVARVRTGVRLAIPSGFFGLVRLRSGFAASGVLLASSGVIDSGYRGEVIVPMVTVNEYRKVKAGDRIAQLLILPQPAATMMMVPLEELGVTARGEGGFGSSGVR